MNDFQKFLNTNKGGITKQLLVAFASTYTNQAGGAIANAINALDKAIIIRITPAPGETLVTSVPQTRQDRQRMTAVNGSQTLDLAFAKVSAFINVLTALERAFDTTITGAYEVPEDRTPKADGRYKFATTKFVTDHVCNFAANGPAKQKEDALRVGKRRLIANGAFTNISVSSTMILKGKQDDLAAEINGRQTEFEKIYAFLTSKTTRALTLLEGEQEEVIFTTKDKYIFYEATRGTQPTDDPIITTYADNYLRYSVQKVGTKWLLHHMAGRAAANGAATPPNGTYQAFVYTEIKDNKGNQITPPNPTFCKIS